MTLSMEARMSRREEMRDVAAGLAKDYVALALAGIGISFPAHHFLGGLFLAFAGAARP